MPQLTSSPDLVLDSQKGQLPALLECVRELLAVFDADGTILFVNSALHTVLGHTPLEIVGKPIAGLIHEDDFDLFLATLRRLAATHLLAPPRCTSTRGRHTATGALIAACGS